MYAFEMKFLSRGFEKKKPFSVEHEKGEVEKENFDVKDVWIKVDGGKKTLLRFGKAQKYSVQVASNHLND
jgi:hypothetical protein